MVRNFDIKSNIQSTHVMKNRPNVTVLILCLIFLERERKQMGSKSINVKKIPFSSIEIDCSC